MELVLKKFTEYFASLKMLCIPYIDFRTENICINICINICSLLINNFHDIYLSENRPVDLRNTDLNSEIFMKKLHRAQEALSQSEGSGTNSIKTLSASFGTKWPYKRTMSAPASMIPRQDTKQGKSRGS